MSIERGFQFQGFYSLLNVPLSLSRGTIFRRQKNPRRGYRPKITGILFVCNEPGRSVAYCAQRSIKKVESYLPACNVFGGIWCSFSGAAYWMVCNSCLRVASPLAEPASTQSQ